MRGAVMTALHKGNVKNKKNYCRFKNNSYLCNPKSCAGGEMVDALVSGTSVSDDVKVRVLSWAPRRSGDENRRSFFFYSACKSLEFILLSCHTLPWFLREGEADRFPVDRAGRAVS